MPPKRATSDSQGESDHQKKKAKTDIDENETLPAKTSPADPSSSSSSSSAETTSKKVWLKKGAAAVDTECEIAADCHVVDQNGDVYDAMLNQTDISYSLKGHNKFIVLQVLQDDKDSGKNFVWQRWGRVGAKGQTKLQGPFPLSVALGNFCHKFHEKTGNAFEDRDKFVPVKGLYDMVQIDHTGTKEEAISEIRQQEKELAKIPDSKLTPQLKSLVELIFNVKEMEAAMLEMNYDAKKAPLGKLTPNQIKIGYECLKTIEDLITASVFGQKLVDACNEYYTKVPHSFGMKKPPLINNAQMVKREMDLLQALGDIEIAMKALKQEVKADVHPLDQHYDSLRCGLQVCARTSEEFEMVRKYLKDTHGATHRDYTMELEELFTVDKPGESEVFRKDLHNKQLLWHGSRVTNFAGILTQGLRIAPPEAPVTGYMFGKGVYFADMSSKSANYTHTSKANNTGILLLCEVALGDINELLDADYHADKLPAGKHSVKGLGKTAPDPSDKTTAFGDVAVPYGKGVSTNVVNPKGFTLQYNEFIVYDLKQIRIRYLLRCRFNYK